MTQRLAEMTTAEAAAAASRETIVVLPIGAFEQHGPGLPLATDLIRAEAVAERVAAELPDLVVIGPAVPVGISAHHLAFAGTVSLRPATFVAVVREYVESLAQHGWRRVLAITGHGGNNAALGVLAQELLQDHPALEFSWTPVSGLASDVIAEMDVSEIHGHSGEAETAQLLHVAPHLVHEDRLEAGTTRLDQLGPLEQLSRRPGHPTLTVTYDRLSPAGVLGDPRRATAEQGRSIIDLVTRRIVAYLKAWHEA